MNANRSLIIFAGVLSLFASLPARSEPSLSLDEAIQLALRQNKEVQASHHAVETAQYQLKSSYGKFLPQVNVEGKYTLLSDPLAIDLSPVREAVIQSAAASANVATTVATGSSAAGAAAAANTTSTLESRLPAFSDTVQQNHYWNAALTATQPLFTGGKLLANMKAQKENLAASEQQDRANQDRIIVEVVQRYFSVQLMKDIVSIRKEVLDGLLEHEKYAIQLLKEGQLSKANKMRSDVAVAEARREHIKAQKDLELAMLLLENVLASDKVPGRLSSPLFLTEKITPLEAYLEMGKNRNPNSLLLDHRLGQLEQKKAASRGNFLPTLGLFGRYEIYKEDLTVLEPQWAVGVAARINLMNGGSDYNDLKAIQHEYVTLDYYSTHIKELIQMEIRKYHHDLSTAREQLTSLETSRALAEENLRLNRVSFQQGVATALEVIDAQLALGKVKAERSKALFDFDVALAQLLRASGNVLEITHLK